MTSKKLRIIGILNVNDTGAIYVTGNQGVLQTLTPYP